MVKRLRSVWFPVKALYHSVLTYGPPTLYIVLAAAMSANDASPGAMRTMGPSV